MKKQNHVRRMSRGAGKQQESLGLRRRRRRTWNVPSWARPQAENDNGEAWYQVSEPPTKVALADFGHSCERGQVSLLTSGFTKRLVASRSDSCFGRPPEALLKVRACSEQAARLASIYPTSHMYRSLVLT